MIQSLSIVFNEVNIVVVYEKGYWNSIWNSIEFVSSSSIIMVYCIMNRTTPPFNHFNNNLSFEGISPKLITTLKSLQEKEGWELFFLFELTDDWPLVELCTKDFKSWVDKQKSSTGNNVSLEFAAFQDNALHLLQLFLWSRPGTLYLTKGYSENIIACLYPTQTFENISSHQISVSDIPQELLSSLDKYSLF